MIAYCIYFDYKIGKKQYFNVVTAIMNDSGLYLQVDNGKDVISMQLVEYSNFGLSIMIFGIVVGSFVLFYFFVIFLIRQNDG